MILLPQFEQPSSHIKKNTHSHIKTPSSSPIFTMNEFETTPFFQHEEEPHRLSFCDMIPLSAAAPAPPSTEPDHLFEFSAAARSYYADVIFCGKVIDGDEKDELNEFQKRDYFAAVKSQSLRRPDRINLENSVRSSASTRFDRVNADPVYHAQRVNITSLTSMSAKSRRRMFMFGPVKFKPEMELAAIKQRQAKMAAAPPPPPSKGKSRWGVVQTGLRGRSRLATVLARSLGCMPVAGGGGGGLDRWVGVAN